MKVRRLKDQQVVKSFTCGELREVLQGENLPLSISVSEDIEPTKAHFHKEAMEIYWVLQGSIELGIFKKDSQRKRIKLHKGDLIVIEPFEYHQVIESSTTNKIIVICSPPWRSEDLFL